MLLETAPPHVHLFLVLVVKLLRQLAAPATTAAAAEVVKLSLPTVKEKNNVRFKKTFKYRKSN
jgi:hypothetical protein